MPIPFNLLQNLLDISIQRGWSVSLLSHRLFEPLKAWLPWLPVSNAASFSCSGLARVLPSYFLAAPPESAAAPASSYYISSFGLVYSLAPGVGFVIYLVCYFLRLRASVAESPSPSIPYECKLLDMNIVRISATALVTNGWSKAWSAVIRSSLSQIKHF